MAAPGSVVEVKQPMGTGPAGQQWMAMPQINVPGIPPGLEYLTQIDQLLMHQQIELFEALTNIECKNRYAIKNSLGQQVFFAFEESDFCHRICCGAQRGFLMHIVDNQSREVIRLERPFKCFAGCCWCADTECCSMEIQIQSPPGQVVGYCRQIGSKWKPMYEVLDANKSVVLKINGPCCACQTICCTGDVDFKVCGTDGVTEVGKISKQWGGFFREIITQADNFSCSFPMDLDVRMKANMIGATFLIDYMFFEQKDNNS
ncbi:phospholipid scramblase 1-like isoform X2 [Patiria miniata]|uniref:Phospholipid scramblase n=1 Tax=Patiria miniata TaxID=46514 RepID=A0A914AAM6_PATMI|nr:phospholipid scramblase 1-like isoform X2 [Patiria miniata]